MIYSIIGTHTQLREKGNREVASLGSATHHIYSDHSSMLEELVDATSLFGDPVIVFCVQLGELASSKEHLIQHLPSMSTSPTIFIIDEPFADIYLYNKLAKVSTKLFDAREEKPKDGSVFTFCNSFIAKNKKQAWVGFLQVKKVTSAEAIQGALWWKFQTEWAKVLEGKRSLFTKEECEKVGGQIIRSSILAHRGEKDLLLEIERVVLSL